MGPPEARGSEAYHRRDGPASALSGRGPMNSPPPAGLAQGPNAKTAAMTPPEPDADAPLRPTPGDAQNTQGSHNPSPHLATSDTDPARPAIQDDSEYTTSLTSPPLPADRQASRLKRPTHPGRPVHAPGASGLLEASEVPIPKPPSRPSSRPVQRPTSLLGSPPTSRPLPRPTDPLAPSIPPSPAPLPDQTSATPPETASDPAPRPPSSRPATLRPAVPRRDTPTALSGPLSAPPGTSPLSPTRPDLDLESARPDAAPQSSLRAAQAPLAPPTTTAPTTGQTGQLQPTSSTRPTRPTRTDPLPTLPDPLDLPLAPGRGAADSAAHPAPGLAPRAPRIAIALAFLAAILLPSAEKPPWLLLDQPAGPTALALAGLLLLPGLNAGPPHLVRWALRLVVVVTLTALTALALADGYARPPWGDALDPLHGSLTLLGLSLLLGSALAASRDRAPRIVAAIGLLLLMAAALVPATSGIPFPRLVATLTAPASTAADTAAAIATLAFAALTLTTAALQILRPGRRLALALAVWAAAIAPLLLHAALSTAPAAWMDAFAPFKTSLAFAAALLCCATAITPALEPEPPRPGTNQAF